MAKCNASIFRRGNRDAKGNTVKPSHNGNRCIYGICNYKPKNIATQDTYVKNIINHLKKQKIYNMEYPTMQAAIDFARSATKSDKIMYNVDTFNMVAIGLQKDGQVCFKIYKSFTKRLKPCFIIRFPYTD